MGNCCIGTFCCEYNCIIFPAPLSSVYSQTLTLQSRKINGCQTKIELLDFENKARQKVPYLRISNERSDKKNQRIIYFHGNAEDIFHSVDFVLPIFSATQITVLCLEYPTYSCYRTEKRYYLSNRIKQNSVEFHQYLQHNEHIPSKNIYIIGRSIGSGPAAYLASKVQCRKLSLISPFDSIRKVSMKHVGCIGFIVKNHFDNQQAILDHKGQLLVIHGKIDEVIGFNHGKGLVQVYESLGNKKCTFIQPPRMSHNYFDLAIDIVAPIKSFLLNEKQVEAKF